jgi:hypothetical protein
VGIINGTDDRDGTPAPAVMPVLLHGIQMPRAAFDFHQMRNALMPYAEVRNALPEFMEREGRRAHLPKGVNDFSMIIINTFCHRKILLQKTH